MCCKHHAGSATLVPAFGVVSRLKGGQPKAIAEEEVTYCQSDRDSKQLDKAHAVLMLSTDCRALLKVLAGCTSKAVGSKGRFGQKCWGLSLTLLFCQPEAHSVMSFFRSKGDKSSPLKESCSQDWLVLSSG